MRHPTAQPVSGKANPTRGGTTLPIRTIDRMIVECYLFETLEKRCMLATGVNGIVFADTNNNGSNGDIVDGRNAAVRVYLDVNDDGQYNSSEPYALTNFDGYYSISGINPGTYTLRQEVPAGWAQITPVGNAGYRFTIATNDIYNYGFTNAPIATASVIQVILVSDNNANGAWDAGDGRNANWQVYLDANNNATFDSGEVAAVSDAYGRVVIAGLPPSTYQVRQVLQPGWRLTIPAGRDFQTVTTSVGGISGSLFASTQAMSTIRGFAYHDLNANSIHDSGEPPLPNWAVYVDANNNAQDDVSERWTTTDALGSFEFEGLPAGSYRVRLIQHNNWSLTAGMESLVAVVNGSDGAAGLTFGAVSNPEPTRYARNRLVAWNLIGGSSNEDADRRVGYNIKRDGWAGFVAQHIQPQLNWGARRVLLHNPFGTLPNQVFQADQYIEARDAGLGWLVNGFADAWRPVTQSGTEVIAYIGSPRNDVDFIGLPPAAWWARFWESVNPIVQAGMTIAWDMSLAANPGDLDYMAFQALIAAGTRIYGEPRPPEDSPFWRANGLVADDVIWKQTDPELNPVVMYWAAKDPQISGEVIRAIVDPPPGQTNNNQPEWLPDYARSILREGHTPAFAVSALIAAGVPIGQILGGRLHPGPAGPSTPPVPLPPPIRESLLSEL